MWAIWRAPTNASKWRMGFNSAFKGLTVPRVLCRKRIHVLPCPPFRLEILWNCFDMCIRSVRTTGSLLGVKRPGLEYGHSPPHKNEWSYTCTPPYAFLVRTGSTVICYGFSLFNFLQSIISKWRKDKLVSWA